MEILYIDCTNGVCGDMFVSGLTALGAHVRGVDGAQLEALLSVDEHHGHRSYQEIKRILQQVEMSEPIRKIAQNIYAVIAEAEASVHESTLLDVHFHEVGRKEAVKNIVTVAALITDIAADKIVCSSIYDGKGTITCSHGVIPVPVPAVKAMMEKCSYDFQCSDAETEMVTPSGLAMLIGMGAEAGERPQGHIAARGTGFGKRQTGRGGMNIYLIEL